MTTKERAEETLYQSEKQRTGAEDEEQKTNRVDKQISHFRICERASRNHFLATPLKPITVQALKKKSKSDAYSCWCGWPCPDKARE